MVTGNIESLLFDLDKAGDWDLFLSHEPEPQQWVDLSDKRLIARIYADYVDQKSGWLHGYSRQVGNLAFRIADEKGLEHGTQ